MAYNFTDKNGLLYVITKIKAMIEELKKSVSDGKSALASAITSNGVSTSADDTFATMADNVGNIRSGGTATAAQILEGKTAYVEKSLITGTMIDRTQKDPSIGGISSSYPTVSVHEGTNLQVNTQTVDGVKRLLMSPPTGFYSNASSYVGVPLEDFGDASVTQVLSGSTFTSSAGLKKTGMIPKLSSATYTPGTADQKIKSGQYLYGTQTIKGDSNLVPENILSGKTIFGVAGAVEAGRKQMSFTKFLDAQEYEDETVYAHDYLFFPTEILSSITVTMLECNYDGIGQSDGDITEGILYVYIESSNYNDETSTDDTLASGYIDGDGADPGYTSFSVDFEANPISLPYVSITASLKAGFGGYVYARYKVDVVFK